MGLKERDLKAELLSQVKAAGGDARKVRWEGRDSAPDWVVMLPKCEHKKWNGEFTPGTVAWAHDWTTPAKTIWVELKRPGLAATFPKDAHERKQWREHERMRKLGQVVVVLDSVEGIAEMLR